MYYMTTLCYMILCKNHQTPPNHLKCIRAEILPAGEKSGFGLNSCLKAFGLKFL